MAKYVLTNQVNFEGVPLKAGKIIDDLAYDVPKLRRAGAILVAQGTASLDALASTVYAAQGTRAQDPEKDLGQLQGAYAFVSENDAGEVPATRQVIAGAGLTGGGNLTADRTFAVGANADGSIIVNVDDIQVGVLATDAQHGNLGGGALHANANGTTAGFMSAAAFNSLATLLSTAIVVGTAAGGDLSGTYPNPTVAQINGASVPAAGALTAGNVLKVSGVSTLTYGAVNLAGGANHVTGTLPTGNQAAQTMSGDVTGTTASNVVATITGSANLVTIVDATNVQHGTNPATSGNFRVKHNYSLLGRDSTNANNRTIFSWGATTNQLDFGDANVAVTISGSTVSFGNNPVIMGTTPATTGDLRLKHGFSWKFRKADNSADWDLISTSSDQIIFSNFTSSMQVRAGSALRLLNSSSADWNLDSSGFRQQGAVSQTIGSLGWAAAFVNGPLVSHTAASGSVAGLDLTIRAQAGGATGAQNGGALLLQGGARTSTGLRGGVKLQFNGTTETNIELVEIASGRRVLAVLRNANLTTTEMPASTGDLVAFWGNAATVPTANPVSGGIQYAEGGAGKWRGSGGTTTTFGPA